MSGFVADEMFRSQEHFGIYFVSYVAPLCDRLLRIPMADIPELDRDRAYFVIKHGGDKLLFYRAWRELLTTSFARQDIKRYINRMARELL